MSLDVSSSLNVVANVGEIVGIEKGSKEGVRRVRVKRIRVGKISLIMISMLLIVEIEGSRGLNVP